MFGKLSGWKLLQTRGTDGLSLPGRSVAPKEVGSFCVQVAVEDVQLLTPHERSQLADCCFAGSSLANQQRGLRVVKAPATTQISPSPKGLNTY